MPLRARTKQAEPVHHGCGRHPNELGVAQCSKCGRYCCESCRVPVRSKILCVGCAAYAAGVTTRRR